MDTVKAFLKVIAGGLFIAAGVYWDPFNFGAYTSNVFFRLVGYVVIAALLILVFASSIQIFKNNRENSLARGLIAAMAFLLVSISTIYGITIFTLEQCCQGGKVTQVTPTHAAETLTPTPEFELIFSDDFENPQQSQSNKWIMGLLENQYAIPEANVTSGVLNLQVKFKDFYIEWIVARNITVTNFNIQFEAAFVSIEPNKETSIAFMLPRENNRNYYAVLFKNTGFIEIAEFDCPFLGTCRYLGPKPYCEDAYDKKTGINEFAIEVYENRYSIYANNAETPICEFEDDSMSRLGILALGVRGSPETNVEVVFDNVEIYAPID